MKKRLFLAVIATVALASCSQDEAIEVNKGRAIDFRVSAEMSTRGTAIETADVMGSFKVTALKDAETTNYFTNQEWTYTGNTWTTPNPAYWPNDVNSTLKFFAYYPANLINVDINSTSQKVTSFSPKKTVKDQVDLLVAYNTGTKGTDENTGVALNFKHALSQIVVEARNHNTNYRIVVKGIKLAQIPSTAVMTFPNENTVYETEVLNNEMTSTLGRESVWQTPSGNELYTVSRTTGGSDVELLGTDTKAKSLMFNDGAFMMIPQQLTGYAKTTNESGAYIAVLCKIYRVDGTNSTLFYPKKDNVGDPEKYAYTMIPINTEWAPGKKYTYTLNFFQGEDGGAGSVDPNPDKGADLDGNGDIDDDIETNPQPEGGAGTDGEIVTGKQITFTVSIDKWKNGTAEDKKM